MTRPFIEFVQAQQLDWQQGLYGGARAGVQSRVLSMDDETGASSVLVRYPPRWVAEAETHLAVDEELFVLGGDLSIDDNLYTRNTYAHLPAGSTRRRTASLEGAVVLTFFSGEPRVVDGVGDGGDESRLVERVDAFEGEWGGNFHPDFPGGAGRKWLRRDPHDGDETWILGTMPLRWGHRPEKHPVVEEMYLLSGELVGHRGKMYPGAYFWRPPEEWHGPFGSPTGNVMLFRTKGGPLSTVYTDHQVEFSWRPPHDPVLPDDLGHLRDQPYVPGCGCW